MFHRLYWQHAHCVKTIIFMVFCRPWHDLCMKYTNYLMSWNRENLTISQYCCHCCLEWAWILFVQMMKDLWVVVACVQFNCFLIDCLLIAFFSLFSSILMECIAMIWNSYFTSALDMFMECYHSSIHVHSIGCHRNFNIEYQCKNKSTHNFHCN